MKSPESITYGEVSRLTPEERFLEIRDIFVAALQRLKAAEESSQDAANELDIDADQSVYAFAD